MAASRLLRVPCLTALAFLIGCEGAGDDADHDYYYDDYLGDAVVTATYGEDWASSAVFAVTDPLEEPYLIVDSPAARLLTVSDRAPAEDPEAAAVRVADDIPRYLTPSDCASVDRNGSELNLVLSGCRALFSASTINGELRASFADDGQTRFTVSSQHLRIDGAEAELSMDGAYRAMQGTKTARFSSRRASRRGERSYSGEFESALTWTAGSNCVRRDATGHTTTARRTFAVTIEGYTRCARECPTAGVITMSDDIARITLTFDGGAAARLERDNGEVAGVDLDCD